LKSKSSFDIRLALIDQIISYLIHNLTK